MMLQKFTIVVLASLFGVAVFAVSLSANFPTQAALDRLEWEVQDRTQGRWALWADDASVWWLSGLALDHPVLYRRAHILRRGQDDAPPAKPFLAADRVAARLGLLPLLGGRKAVNIEADLYGGEIDASVTDDANDRTVSAHASGIDLSKIPLEGETWKMALEGKAQFDGEVKIDLTDARKSTGDLTLQIAQAAIDSAEIMGMNLTKTPFSEARVEMTIDDGKAKVTYGHLKSDPIDVEVGGEITLSKRIERSRLHISLVFSLDDQYDRLARMMLRRARDDQGKYHYLITGTLSRPRLHEDITVSRGGRISVDRRPRPIHPIDRPPPTTEQESDSNADSDEAARRQRRLDRIRARRERMRRMREQGGPGADFNPPSRLPGPPGSPQPLPPMEPGIDQLMPPDDYVEPGPDGDYGPPGGPDDYGTYDDAQQELQQGAGDVQEPSPYYGGE